MAKPLTDKECKDILIQAKQWDDNSQTTVFKDFVNIAHDSFDFDKHVDFEKYGFTELTMFGECLTLFNDRGYDIVKDLINNVYEDVE